MTRGKDCRTDAEKRRDEDWAKGIIRAEQTTEDLAVLESLTNRLHDCTIVEVGVWIGGLTIWLARKLVPRGCVYHAVDNFSGDGNPHMKTHIEAGRDPRAEFQNNMRRARLDGHVRLHDCPSVEAAKLFNDASIAFVYIDADHRPESVAADVRAWLPKVRGLLAGHDGDNDGVRAGLEKVCDEDGIGPLSFQKGSSVWWLQV